MAKKAQKARSLKAVIPIYINLKTLNRQHDKKKQTIDQNLIRDFVLQTLNRPNDADIEAFLDEAFELGLHEGTWLFLFDSFDEIPEILSSVDAAAIINRYAEAISDFLRGMNRCRGIVASREYRGPRRLGWSRFRILTLSEKRQYQLIKKADLRGIDENQLIGELGAAPNNIRLMSSNPMFLGLICNYAQKNNEFPTNSYVVYEEYIDNRLHRDATRLQHRFQLQPAQVRIAAERLAYCMAADSAIGLSPTRADLLAATMRQDLSLGNQFDKLLDSLEFIKLARSETNTLPGEPRNFTFAHRRFQEYFATSVVIREPHRVSPYQLLTDGLWRETATVLFQTQPIEALQTLIAEAENLLSIAADKVPIYPEDLPTSSSDNNDHQHEITQLRPEPFSWLRSTLHLLSILQEGFTGRYDTLPDGIRNSAGQVLLSATNTGTRMDQKWSLEVAGIMPQPSLLFLLRNAFNTPSQWLRNTAYKQITRLQTIPEDIRYIIFQTLSRMLQDGTLIREKHVTKTYLQRINGSKKFVAVMEMLLFIPPISITLHLIALLTITWVWHQSIVSLQHSIFELAQNPV